MEFNYLAILIAVVAQFVLGFIWYGPLFGTLWGKIHGFDKLSKETQQKMMKAMGPFYALQFFMTIITTVVLDIFINFLPENWNIYALAGFFWLGFVLPTFVSAVIFGGTEGKWIFKKIAIQAVGSLIFLETAAIILKNLS
jgi:hypothetical protein